MMDLGGLLKTLKPNGSLKLPPGRYEGGLVLRVPGVHLWADPGTVTIANGDHYALKLDGANGCRLSGINFSGSRGHGVMAVGLVSLVLADLICDGNQGSGILTGDCGSVMVQRCLCRNNGQHGIYLSASGGNYRVQHCTATGNVRCGCQINAHPGHAKGAIVTDNDLRNNHNAGVQFAGVDGGTIADNQVDGNRQPVVVWDDNGGAAYACRNLDLLGQPGPIKVHPLCTVGIKVQPGVREWP